MISSILFQRPINQYILVSCLSLIMSFNLKQYLNTFVFVVLTEGYVIEGKLVGFDNHMNITIEKQIIQKQENDIISIEIIRGENIVFIGELDLEKLIKINEKNDEESLKKFYNNKAHKVYKSTKNKVDKTTIKAWKLFNQLWSKSDTKKRKLSINDDENMNIKRKTDLSIQ